ncbi:hypothetical protein TYRP_011449, partial [Tyrophagus putrescentiae]
THSSTRWTSPPLLTDDCLLAIFARVPLQRRLTTVPLVCRRWAKLQPMVRRDVTSLTLTSSVWSSYRIRSPFHLLNHHQDFPEIVLDAPHAVERLLDELPNIRRLTIAQPNTGTHYRYYPAIHADLLFMMEHYGDQLTAFAFHYLSCCDSRDLDEYDERHVSLEGREGLSADFQRLLSIINYGMPRLRHLLLNTDRTIFDAHQQRNFPLGSLYLPVLRRLASFSFRSGDHEDVLLGSLGRFASGSGPSENGDERRDLTVRLGVPFFLPVEEDSSSTYKPYSTMNGDIWEADALLRLNLDYLFAERIYVSTLSSILPSLASLQYLHLELIDGGRKLRRLFTALSTSLPLLSRLYLKLGGMLVGNLAYGKRVPLLPPLPSVTSLTLDWAFANPEHFGAVLQPAQAFPALQSFTIDVRRYKFIRCRSSPECRCSTTRGPSQRDPQWEYDFQPVWFEALCIRQVLKAPLMQYPPGGVPQVVLITKHGKMKVIVEELVPLFHRLDTIPLVCRRWKRLQPVVRRAATSLTLIHDELSDDLYNYIKSPFHLVDHQASIQPQTVERLLVELPNIRQLTIIQLNDNGFFPVFAPELWSLMEHYARQLTRFDFHYLYNGNHNGWRPEEESGRAALSADFQRLLSLINYGMPKLRHLLLDSEPAIIEPENQRNMFANPSFPLGSLYLPVLKRLRSFSFRSGDHEDVLFGSLKKFAGNEQSALKLRSGCPCYAKRHLVSNLPSTRQWKANFGRLMACDFYSFIGWTTFFLPQLTRLHLNLHQMLWHNPVPADLPPLPSVTSLSLYWPFDNSVHFEPVLQLARVFPALQKLTIDGQMFEGCSIDSLECHCTRVQLAFGFLLWGEIPPLCIRPALKASLMQYPPEAVPLINLNTKGGRKWFTVEEFVLGNLLEKFFSAHCLLFSRSNLAQVCPTLDADA